MRTFTNQSMLIDGNLALAIAPALTPAGIDNNPSFFRGVAAYPQVLARGLLVLSDITSTRYFKYSPVTERDPVLSAQGDRLRAECFSACNGVYARLDLLQSGFDGEIGFGTTNIDIGIELRTALTQVNQKDQLHVDISSDGFTALPVSSMNEKITKLEKKIHERPVQMPDRWVRALGNATEIHRNMKPVLRIKGIAAQTFIASLPPATGKNQAYFHRELPDDQDRIMKDNPRLVAARKLVDMVESIGESKWSVHSNEIEYRVHLDSAHGVQEATCTCTWYLNHQNKRGPCKHILAVQLYSSLRG